MGEGRVGRASGLDPSPVVVHSYWRAMILGSLERRYADS